MSEAQPNIAAGLLDEILKRVSQDVEYLSIDDVAAKLKCSRKTIVNRISAGVYREGVHYFRPEGVKTKGKKKGGPSRCDPLFKWSALVAWVEGQDAKAAKSEPRGIIPMRKGYSP
jgi:hypothetical protein